MHRCSPVANFPCMEGGNVTSMSSRLAPAQGVLKRSGNCGSLCLTIGLMVALAVLLVVAFKLASLF